MYAGLNNNYLKFPTKPQKKLDWLSFPNDLVQDGRNFYTEINFAQYSVGMQQNETSILRMNGGIRLPVPRKINDNTLLTWREVDATTVGTSLLSSLSRGRLGAATAVAQASGLLSAASTAAQISTGYALNPFLYMMFQRPNYKEFVLSWSFTPNNEQESRTIRRIIRGINS